MKPFFVLNRPNQLTILEKLESSSQCSRFGILLNLNNVNNSFYPRLKQSSFTKICDSGIFDGEMSSYIELFNEYQKVSADYGIVKDYYRDSKRTLLSAREALKYYNMFPYDFKLVGVAQGETVDEYLNTYSELLDMGYDHIAIGGLLEPHLKTRKINEELLFSILQGIEENFGSRWVFVLGANAKTRASKLKQYDIFGSDSNNWVFRYKKDEGREKGLTKYVRDVSASHCPNTRLDWFSEKINNGEIEENHPEYDEFCEMSALAYGDNEFEDWKEYKNTEEEVPVSKTSKKVSKRAKKQKSIQKHSTYLKNRLTEEIDGELDEEKNLSKYNLAMDYYFGSDDMDFEEVKRAPKKENHFSRASRIYKELKNKGLTHESFGFSKKGDFWQYVIQNIDNAEELSKNL